MNKKEKYYMELYQSVVRADNYAHYGVQYFYKTPSQNKIDAELSILRKMYEEGGYGYRVLCGSIFTFTCGYLVNENECVWLRVFTKTKDYKILLEV